MSENRRISIRLNLRSRNELSNSRQQESYVNHTISQPHVDQTAPVHVYLQVPPPVVVIAPNLLIDPFDQRALMVARDPYALAQEYPMLYGPAVPPPPYSTVASPAPAVIPPPCSTVASPAPAVIPPPCSTVASPAPAVISTPCSTVSSPAPAVIPPPCSTVTSPAPAVIPPPCSTVASPAPDVIPPPCSTVAAPAPAVIPPPCSTVANPAPVVIPPPCSTVASPAPAAILPPYSTVASPAPAAIQPAVSNVPATNLNTMFSNLYISDQASSRSSMEPRSQSDSTSRVFCGPQLPPHMLFRMMYGPAVPPLSEMINHWFVPGLPTAQTQAETRDEDEWIPPGYRYIPSTEMRAVSDRHNGFEDSDGMERNSRRYILCPYNNYGQCRNEYCEYMHGAKCYVCRMPRLDIYNEDRRKRHIEDCLLSMSIGQQCGLCEEHIPLSDTTRNFTILDNCQHCFCRPCFTSWRRQVNEQNISFCPYCSTPFKIFCRSKYWFESQELKEDIQEYFDSVFQLRNNDLLRCQDFDFVLEKLFRE